jgi:hypothetical protein
VNQFAATLALLERAGIAAGSREQLRHAWLSYDERYCAVTLDNLQSYIVDLAGRRYLHYPQASAAGFDGHIAILRPDDVRFNLMSWEDDLAVDLDAERDGWTAVPP